MLLDGRRGGAARVTDSRPGSYVILSTFPPTECGVATFTGALCNGLESVGANVGVVVVGHPADASDPHVVARLDGRDIGGWDAAVGAIDRADVFIVQHEYGLYPGIDGESVGELLEAVSTPTIVVAHTVLASPSPHQRAVLERAARAADVVVVMTDAGRRRLRHSFDVDPDKVVVVPHGAAVRPARDRVGGGDRQELLTWGLLGPGKGIEWAIDALAELDRAGLRPQYRVAGDTHPKVAAREGERYRDMLEARARRVGVGSSVVFDAGYRGLDALDEIISSAVAVVLPYDSADQVTSGVLVDAVAAGRPVIATAFPHAQELLASGAGLVVPQRDPEALAHAFRRVLCEDGLAERMGAEARRLAPSLAWPAVAARYASLGSELVRARGAVPA